MENGKQIDVEEHIAKQRRTRAGFKKADFQQQKLMEAKLHEVLIKNADGTVSYFDGWDDDKVASEIGEGLNQGHVRHFRQKEIGALYVRGKTTGKRKAEIGARNLVKRVAFLEERDKSNRHHIRSAFKALRLHIPPDLSD